MPTEINPKRKMVASQGKPAGKYVESETLSQELKELLTEKLNQNMTPNMTPEEQKRSYKGTLSNNPEDED
jgi:hypothetical protein